MEKHMRDVFSFYCKEEYVRYFKHCNETTHVIV